MNYIMAILSQNRKFNLAKISHCADFCQKAYGYYENLKQNIWTEFLPIPTFTGLRDPKFCLKY